MHLHYVWIMFQKMFHLIIRKRPDYMGCLWLFMFLCMVFLFVYDYDTIDVEDILDIHKYLMKSMMWNNVYIN